MKNWKSFLKNHNKNLWLEFHFTERSTRTIYIKMDKNGITILSTLFILSAVLQSKFSLANMINFPQLQISNSLRKFVCEKSVVQQLVSWICNIFMKIVSSIKQITRMWHHKVSKSWSNIFSSFLLYLSLE